MMMYLLAWGSGCAIGLILMALKPWAPDVVTILQLVYVRANMIASGKMFVANTLPGFMLGDVRLEPAVPHHRPDPRLRLRELRSALFELAVSAIRDAPGLIMLGMMGEFFTRKRASISWDARR
jgi:xanthosine utilization system XapX-like protein